MIMSIRHQGGVLRVYRDGVLLETMEVEMVKRLKDPVMVTTLHAASASSTYDLYMVPDQWLCRFVVPTEMEDLISSLPEA